jgi:hypothetical protein
MTRPQTAPCPWDAAWVGLTEPIRRQDVPRPHTPDVYHPLNGFGPFCGGLLPPGIHPPVGVSGTPFAPISGSVLTALVARQPDTATPVELVPPICVPSSDTWSVSTNPFCQVTINVPLCGSQLQIPDAGGTEATWGVHRACACGEKVTFPPINQVHSPRTRWQRSAAPTEEANAWNNRRVENITARCAEEMDLIRM